ncbi:MAG: hypothetical protein ACOC0N_05245 [Chroococcales cyanobacterium]
MLLEAIDAELAKSPHLSFSDLCKAVLWEALCSSETEELITRLETTETQVTELQAQLAQMQKQLANQDFRRLDAVEREVEQLWSELSSLVNQSFAVQAVSESDSEAIAKGGPSSVSASEGSDESEESEPPVEVDPVLSRLSSLVDDF